jgi:hypothetical protein
LEFGISESEFQFDDFSTEEFNKLFDRNIRNQKQNWYSASNGGPRNQNQKSEFPTKPQTTAGMTDGNNVAYDLTS